MPRARSKAARRSTAARRGNLLTILGPQQPLTMFGADAGVLRLTLLDGTDAIVTVRDVPQTDAQLAFVQPVDAALADWRQAARIEITLLVLTGLVLTLLAGGLWYLAPAASAPERGRAGQGADRGIAGLRRLALEPRPRPCALVVRRCTACSALSRATRRWRSEPSPRRCIPTTICAARSTGISARAPPCSTAASGCAMPADIG